MKQYKEQIEDMRILRDSLDNALTDMLNKVYSDEDTTEIYLMKAQIELTVRYLDILDARISHATLKEQLEVNDAWESYKVKGGVE